MVSIVDVIGLFSKSVDVHSYWRKLKQRLKVEVNETVTNFHGLKKENLMDHMTFLE